MSDAPPAGLPESLVGGREDAAGLTPAAVDAVLADFRTWLSEAAPPADVPGPPPFDLFALVGQFTALRHDVSLQTKAVRAAVEQNAKLIAIVEDPPAADDDALKPLLKAVLDAADALTAALKRVRQLAPEDAAPLTPPPYPEAAAEPDGFFAKFLGRRPAANADAVAKWRDDVLAAAAENHRVASGRAAAIAKAAADGYAMSLRRLEQVLPLFGLELIDCLGRPFDPDAMEVVETTSAGEKGTVAEVVRLGYTRGGKIFRFAQVVVTA